MSPIGTRGCLLSIVSGSLLTWSIFMISFWVPPRVSAQKDLEREKALKIWELAVAAKGGRDRLHSVQSLVISTSGTYSHRAKRYQRYNEALFVLPNKIWIWNDQRPDVFGLTLEVSNFETNKRFVTNSDREHPIPRAIPTYETPLSRTYGLLAYLMETRWVRPQVENLSTATINGTAVDIVRTMVQDTAEGFEKKSVRIDFALDRQTHLPVQVIFYQKTTQGEEVSLTESLSQYVEVDGIKIPTRRVVGGAGREELAFQFNVTFDANIFDNPPSLRAGPKGWKESK